MIFDVTDLALVEREIEHGKEFSVGAGIGDERRPARIFHCDWLRDRIMGMAAEDDVDAGDAACELEIDVHAVMRQQDDRIDLVGAAQAVDMLLEFFLPDAEGPVRREPFGMRDRHVREGLADDRDAMAAELLDHGGLEHAPRRLVEGGGVVECRFLAQENVLRQKLALEAREIVAQRLLAVGEFPMPGHRLDTEQVCGLDHVAALHDVGESRALPEVAAVNEQGVLFAGIAAQAVDQRLQMGEAAELAEAACGLLELEAAEGIGVRAVGPDGETVEEGAPDQMRRPSGHLADPDIDAGLAKIDRIELRMRVGEVKDPRIAEPFEVVNARGLSTARKPWQAERCGSKACILQEIAAADRHPEILRALSWSQGCCTSEQSSGFPSPSRLLFRKSPGRSTL